MHPNRSIAYLALAAFTCLGLTSATAHEGHDHGEPAAVSTASTTAPDPNATTGSGDFVFRYRADLSELPAGIAKGIKPAHGGFAKTPSGEIYFGLEGTGLIRLSADLKDKTLVSAEGDLVGGGLHNTTYLDRDGGQLVLPDNNRGQVLIVGLDGSKVMTLGMPEGIEPNQYHPTDADLASNGLLYVCNGYSANKLVVTADLDEQDYADLRFGGWAEKRQTEARFSTNHGVTFDPTDDTLVIADREHQWAQRLSLDGEFVEGYQTLGNVCDIDFVEFDGERLMIAGCLRGPDNTAGVVQVMRDGEVVSTLSPKSDLGLDQFEHIHNAIGVVVDEKLFVLCYGWNPGCYAVLEHVTE
ncbi:MAG: hypothetical protein AAF266_04200 [Planctomycetota bacterium]